MTSAIRATAVPWYERENYSRILEIMADAKVLHPTYEKWRYAADKLVRQLEGSGMLVIRANIDPDEFVAWCNTRGLNVDAKARTAFANEVAYQAARQTH